MEMSAKPHFIDKLISYFGKKLFVIIMPFEALGGVQVGDIAVCWSILISLSVKSYMLWLFFEGIVLGEVKVTGFRVTISSIVMVLKFCLVSLSA